MDYRTNQIRGHTTFCTTGSRGGIVHASVSNAKTLFFGAKMSIVRHNYGFDKFIGRGGVLWGSRNGLTLKAAGAVLSYLVMALVSPSYGQELPSPILVIDFARMAKEELQDGVNIKTQFSSPDFVPGPGGRAWRTDGFSSYLDAALKMNAERAFTISMWVALESYPSDLEVPADMLAPSSLAQQFGKGKGYDIYLDTFGRWGFRVATNAGILDARATEKFELGKWNHIIASVDTEKGIAIIYNNGVVAGKASFKPGSRIVYADAPFRLAIPPVGAKILDFNINRINGAYSHVSVFPIAIEPDQIANLPGPKDVINGDASSSLVVPNTRFANDQLRPKVHPIPSANWTNEPHGLLRLNGRWHMFYQRTPNGPFKTQMVWGHMSSNDLVTWSHHQDALRPELQDETFGFDMKGIWSGHVIADQDKAFAFYTSVNHRARLSASNPGIAMAVSTDPQLNTWKKLGPILNSEGLKDFRDPYVWREGETWHMLVGAALESGGGLAYYRLQKDKKEARWYKQHRFTETSFRVLDVGSEIWEMPVFEKLSDERWILAVNPVGGKVTKYGHSPTRTIYWIGQWKDGIFTPVSPIPQNLDLLPGHLAPTVARAQDGSLRAIGIIDERRTPESQRIAGWANTFGLPRRWYLMPDQRTLGQSPAPELLKLRDTARTNHQKVQIGAEPTIFDAGEGPYELEVGLDSASKQITTINIDVLVSADRQEFTRLTFDLSKNYISVDKVHSSLSDDAEGPKQINGLYDAKAFGEIKKICVFVDGSVIEVFVNDAASFGIRSYPTNPSPGYFRIATKETTPIFADVQTWILRKPDE